MNITGPTFPSAAPTRQTQPNGPTDTSEARAAAEGIFAQLVHQMLQEMRSTLPEGGLIDIESSGEGFQSLFDYEIADRIAAQDDSIVTAIKESLLAR